MSRDIHIKLQKRFRDLPKPEPKIFPAPGNLLQTSTLPFYLSAGQLKYGVEHNRAKGGYRFVVSHRTIINSFFV